MNRRTINLLLCALAGVAATAQTEQPDSIKVKKLDEVVVKGKTQRVIDHGVEYIPEKKVKKAAMDAIRLLELMNIPQLDITPGSTTVKTYSGKDVAMYIDYVEATSEDLKGLRPEDVLRVEVLQYPEDPRFKGQQNVINYIMRKYEWGGYSKLSAWGNTLDSDWGSALLYSKFVNKKWIFDANVSADLSHNDNYSSCRTETFRNIVIDGNRLDAVKRISQSGGDYLRQGNAQSASFRAIRNTHTSQIIHTISFWRQAIPMNRNLSSVSFSEDLIMQSSALSKVSEQTLSPRISGRYYFEFSKNNSLTASWNFGYGSTRRYSSYKLGDLEPIVNNNKEKSYEPTAIIQYSKRFSHNNTLRTSLMSFNSIFHTDYAGSYNGLQKLLSSENMLFLEYMQNWKQGLSLFSRVGVSYVIGRVNGVNTLEQWNPRLGMQLQYRINDRNSASIEGWWGNNHPTPASSNTAIVQSNELMWLQGNPELRNTTFMTASGSYNFIPTNQFSLSATAEYTGNLNKTAYEFSVKPGYNGLVRKEINSGDFHQYSGYLSATLRLLGNSLSLRGSGKISRMVVTGIDARAINVITANVQANYFVKGFSLVAYYQTPGKYLSAFNHGIRTRYKSTYGVLLNYSIGDFKAGFQFRNWFNKNRFYTDFNSENYSFSGWEWSGNYARNIQLNLSYTLPYGKKVQRGNEISGAESAGSAILK